MELFCQVMGDKVFAQEIRFPVSFNLLFLNDLKAQNWISFRLLALQRETIEIQKF